MASANSTRRERPSKPYPDFPLGWHPSGYWCKRINGKLQYFGPRWGDWKQALEDYERNRDALYAGRTRADDPDGATVRYLCNAFLTDRKHRREVGELTQRSFDDYRTTCQRLVDVFGAGRIVKDLRPVDFIQLRSRLADGWSPTTLSNEITRIRVVFSYGWQAGLIETPMRFGPSFKKPSRRVVRQYQQTKEAKLFTSDQIRDLVDIAPTQLRAMILLGVNAGLGNRDIGLLRQQHIRHGWLSFPRPKTSVDRRCPLWPETLEAIQLVERDLVDHYASDLVFTTRHGRPWSTDSKASPISREFRKLLVALNIYTHGKGFYTLRHVFRTVADETKDQPAIDYIMGHARDDMASVYREQIADERLVVVANHVRTWLFGGNDNE